MKIIDAQRWMAVAYSQSLAGTFQFKADAFANLRGRSMFQQAAQTLGYVEFRQKTDKHPTGYIWADLMTMPDSKMGEVLLAEYKRLQRESDAKKKIVEPAIEPTQPDMIEAEQPDELSQYSRYKRLIDKIDKNELAIKNLHNLVQGLYPVGGAVISNQVAIAEKLECPIKHHSIRGGKTDVSEESKEPSKK